jgi:hypothetical protein
VSLGVSVSGQQVLPVPAPQSLRAEVNKSLDTGSGAPATINLAFSADSLLLLGGLAAWGLRLLWVKVMQPQVKAKLDGAFAPVEEERLLNVLVTQIGGLTQASRVMLGAFHNGTIDHEGYHYTKISAVNTYVAQGVKPMRDPVRDLPLGRIMPELEALLLSHNQWIHYSSTNADTPPGCKAYLDRNDIQRISSHLIKVGNLPIGILSIQWDADASYDRRQLDNQWIELNSDTQMTAALRHAVHQIGLIMRRRVIRPPAYQRLVAKIRNPFSTGS